MFSGTRSTDLINTLLNLAYYQIANDVAVQCGVVPKDIYHVHQGDDVWLSSTNVVWGRLLYYVLNNQGFVFQSSKQMFGTGRGEFLRVLYQQGTASGYLMRAIVNFLLRPLQNSMNIGATEWANTATESCRMLHRRGLRMSLCNILWEDIIDNRTKVLAHPSDSRPVRMPLHYIVTPKEFGGLGAVAPGFYCLLKQCPPAPKPDSVTLSQSLLEAVPSKMTDDWISYLSPKIHAVFPAEISSQFRANAFKTSLVTENYAEQALQHDKKRIATSYKTAVAKLSHECKSDSEVRNNFLIPVRSPSELPKMMGCNPLDVTQPDIFNKDYIGRSVLYSSNHPENLVNPTRYSKALARLTASSMFKTESRLAQAFGLSRLHALQLLMSEVSSSPSHDASLAALLTPIIANGREDLLDMLQKGGTSTYSIASCWQDARFTNYVASVASELLVSSAVFSISSQKTNPYASFAGDYATMAQLLTIIPYPASLIKY
jgi:hypothetical protein